MSDAFANEQIVVSLTTVGPDLTVVNGGPSVTTRAVLSVQNGDLLLRYDGGDPDTSGEGILITAGTVLTVDGAENVRNILMVRSGAVDADVNATYETGV